MQADSLVFSSGKKIDDSAINRDHTHTHPKVSGLGLGLGEKDEQFTVGHDTLQVSRE